MAERDEREASSSSNGHDSEARDYGFSSVINHLLRNKTDATLWITRILTVVFTFGYIIPVFPSLSQNSCYQKALVANAATSALRLHQRVPAFRLSRQFMATLLMEDSAHYLMYSIIFLYQSSITMCLLPVSLFAFLHLSSFTVILSDKMSPQRGTIGTFFVSIVERYQRNILQMVALTEIVIMPFVVIALFSGIGSIFTPFIYYRFLTLRYASRRNPYTRTMFHELRLSTEYLIYHQSCPLFIRNIAISAISFISRLAPPQMA